jgi:hypothetical protein
MAIYRSLRNLIWYLMPALMAFGEDPKRLDTNPPRPIEWMGRDLREVNGSDKPTVASASAMRQKTKNRKEVVTSAGP